MSNGPRSRDLTRWNRAGLERFRYVDGNAITHLEHLRARFAEAFPAPLWEMLREREILEDEQPLERLQRITEQYDGRRRDWAWEIARSFARAAHVLTEHVDAFANEGYLGTATQWEYLRRLVAMIDYRPAPPASASTTLALIAKDGAKGLVRRGFQTKHTPQNGDPPVIFETLEDVEIDPALDVLRLRDWNHNPEPFDPVAPLTGDAGDPWVLPEGAEVSVGQLGVLTAPGVDPVPIEVNEISEARDRVAVIEGASSLALGDTSSLVRGDTELLLAPDDVRAPRLNGPDVAILERPHGLTTGAVVGWRRGETLGFARVVTTDGFALKLTDVTPAEPKIGAAGTVIFLARELTREQYAANENEWRLPLDLEPSAEFRIAVLDEGGGIDEELLTEENLEEARTSGHTGANEFLRLKSELGLDAHSLRFFDADRDRAIGSSIGALDSDELEFDGAPAGLASGDHMVAEDEKGQRRAVRIGKIEESADFFRLTFDGTLGKLQGVAWLHGPFGLRLRPQGHDRNPDPVDRGALILDLADEVIPDRLSSGRKVVVEPEDPATGGTAFAATVTAVVDAEEGDVRIELDAAASAYDGHTTGGLVIRASAVAAGHGETKPQIALGSGEASAPSQSFVLAKGDVSFVADPTLEAGVRAAIEIVVDGRRYEEVASFADSEPGDAHYTVRTTEEGRLRLTFGDGYRGRRLPTGRNNVRAAYRVGTGSAGNDLAPGSLEKPVRPHDLIASVRQPLVTTGGQDAESSESVRRSAPAHLRALSRAVSLADYEYLAASQPGVWSAKARQNPEGAERGELIEVIVVPADGGPLGDLKPTIEERLVALGVPGPVIRIERFDEVPLLLEATLRVDSSAFDPAKVEAAVRAALYEVLKLEVRTPGQPLYRSEIFRVVEAVEGLANSDVDLFAGQPEPLRSTPGNAPLRPSSRSQLGDIWVVWPTERQVVFVRDPSDLALVTAEAVL